MLIQELHQLFLKSKGICTDTRAIVPGTIFFALKGENFNGNHYAKKAINEGCLYAVVDDVEDKENSKYIVVDSVLETLQKLANFHRKQFNIPVIGITGSNGKTTTKELLGKVLKQKYSVLITKGNLNNHLGVPFTLLKLDITHELAIIEMGANKPNDIKELVEIAEPTHGIITNIGTAHIEGFGSFEGVLKTKLELYDFIGLHKGILFVNKDDSLLVRHIPKNCDIKTYGITSNDSTIKGELVASTPYVQFTWQNHESQYKSPVVKTNLVGGYNLTNMLASICVGNYFKVEPYQINKAIENYKPSNHRSQVTKTENNTLIVDCYNANPTSMLSALESFNKIEVINKAVILGDMLELGHLSAKAHQDIVEWLIENNLRAYLIGEEFMKTKSPFNSFKSIEHFLAETEPDIFKDLMILLKGSRGIQLERLIDKL
jgi:UDP-N-acetylmuramoyl-tripeptide--D-alanyl-D-alanine ligase